jgi:hypothetical protein
MVPERLYSRRRPRSTQSKSHGKLAEYLHQKGKIVIRSHAQISSAPVRGILVILSLVFLAIFSGSGERIDSNRRIEEMEEDLAGEAPRCRSVQVVRYLRRRGVGKGPAATATSYGRRELAAGDGGN